MESATSLSHKNECQKKVEGERKQKRKHKNANKGSAAYLAVKQ
jgi:hypothetical protein